MDFVSTNGIHPTTEVVGFLPVRIVKGPFTTNDERDRDAKRNWMQNGRTKFDTLHRLDIDENGKAVMCQYDIDEEIEINDGE